MAMTFVVHAQYDSHVSNIIISIVNLNFDDLIVAALAPPSILGICCLIDMAERA